MIFISHRGNINGRNEERENSVSYILEAIEAGYDVEVDVWYDGKNFNLGHDSPQYQIEIDFLRNEKLWCHAKNLQALDVMLSEKIHCFWHQNDDYTLTSRGVIWAYPGKILNSRSICVMPEWSDNISTIPSNCMGVCSDFVQKLR